MKNKHSSNFSDRDSLHMFEIMCRSRYFELELAKIYKTGIIKAPIYLSLGQESIAAGLSVFTNNYLMFGHYRSIPTYVGRGGDLQKLVDELLHRKDGMSQGKAGLAGVNDPKLNIYANNTLVGDQVPLAVGAALGSNKPTITIFGDAGAEEDYVLGALGFAASKKTPVLFVCEDNDLAILTPKKVRRSWNIVEVAKSFGLEAIEIDDDPWEIAQQTKLLSAKLPALINIRTCRHNWHAGVGTDAPPKWNRFELVKQKLTELNLKDQMIKAEEKIKKEMETLWEKQLQKQ